jgi:tRNA (uracil-5-)-methyltransferase
MNAEEEGQNGAGGVDEDGKAWECKIGFERKGKPGVMDIEVS